MSAAPDFGTLKSNLKATWMAGDFGEIAKFTQKVAEAFVARAPIRAGNRLLDVACGTGNVSLPAARAGAEVTGVDIATNLLEQARARAAAEKLPIAFQEGDAEDLPFPDQQFDFVVSMFGAMFAPRPERVASELVRVCKPGGMIAMANWTPDGFVGKSFQITSAMAPLPPGIPEPVLWGSEEVVRERLHGVARLTLRREAAVFEYPFPPKEVMQLFRRFFGPMQATFARLDTASQASLERQMEALWTEHNLATDGTTRVTAEYLDVRAIR